MTPTDEGICCSFNMPAAEEIYVKSEYTRIVADLQNGKIFIEIISVKEFLLW